jgi:hypothetical protein
MGRLVVVRRRFWKKVSKVLMACCVGDPSVRKGATGRALRSTVTFWVYKRIIVSR